MRINNADWSTINLEALQKRPVCTLPLTYHLQTDSGNCCAGNPPGYPSYFTRNVYTRCGNGPRRGWEMVITYQGINYGIRSADNLENWDNLDSKVLRGLWKPLPIDHPRTQAWIIGQYSHMQHCYLKPGVEQPWNNMIIYPVPYYQLETFVDDERFSDAWRIKEKAAIEQKNLEIEQAARRFATVDNHAATVSVRKYYPDFTPTRDHLECRLKSTGNWWETLAERPKPEKCPGQYDHKHPVNGTWCQFCGWRANEKL